SEDAPLNYAYMIQWWLFAAAVPFGYVVLARAPRAAVRQVTSPSPRRWPATPGCPCRRSCAARSRTAAGTR
ncbi:hypothetical protein ABZT12_11050, partial [Streptomyces sp. NPDC005423]